MLRYLRLYIAFVRFGFSRAMEFRLDFWFRVVMDCVFYVTQFVFFGVIYRHTEFMAGWNYDQILIFAAAVMYSDAVNMTVFSNNMWWLPQLINRGDLDYHLVRPVSSLFFVTLRDFAANSFVNLLIATGLLAWTLARYPGELGFGNIVLFFVLLAIGNLLYAWSTAVFLIPTFWLHSGTALREMSMHLQRYAERPHGIYTGWLRRIVLSILPFALMISIPTEALFEGITWQRVLHIAAVCAAAFAFLVWFWNRGLRAYSSASS